MDPDAILPAVDQQPVADTEARDEQERVSYLGFYLGADVYGLPLEQLREVARVSHLRRIPGAPAGVAGLVNLRGEILCALDVRAILGLPPQSPAETPFIVALRGFGDPLGLVVDSIADIYAVGPGDIEAPPAVWPAERAACFIGTARVAAGLMGLLDLAKVTKA
jgi:purine-binding chemotaxis protein CheW